MNTFGQPIPVRDVETGAVTGSRPAAVSRVTRASIGGQFGSDRGKRLVVSLRDGDVIAIRPERTRREETMTVEDIYRFMLRSRAGREVLEKARSRKARLAEQRINQKIARADRKLRMELRAEKGGE